MRVSDFHFDLPAELIAQHPPAERGSSRMLVVDRAKAGNREQGAGNEKAAGELRDATFRDLPDFLQPGDLLVLNDSRVLPARLFATRSGLTTQANSPQPSGVIEVLLTEEVEGSNPTSQNLDVGHPHSNTYPNVWRALVKPARKVQPGEVLHFHAPAERSGEVASGPRPALTAEVTAAGEFGERMLRFGPVEDFYGTLARIGHMPLPPYILRDQAVEPDTEEDRERYQTVYSHQPGSAAAPTAGLHFTAEVLAALTARGVEIQYLTLHAGLGTFQPVRVEEVDQIRLHAERYTLPAATADALNRALAAGRRIVAVGTTTTRTLEHIAATGRIEAHSGSTSIFIGPGHPFRVVSGLLTNFHLPESTLLMLVAAFAGQAADPEVGRRAILGAYAHAIAEGYRFYSYGDCMLLL